jgi:hypothetical protein
MNIATNRVPAPVDRTNLMNQSACQPSWDNDEGKDPDLSFVE